MSSRQLGEVRFGRANFPRSNHNMDPNIVNSASFGLQWKVPFNTNEQVSKIHRFLSGLYRAVCTLEAR